MRVTLFLCGRNLNGLNLLDVSLTKNVKIGSKKVGITAKKAYINAKNMAVWHRTLTTCRHKSRPLIPF